MTTEERIEQIRQRCEDAKGPGLDLNISYLFVREDVPWLLERLESCRALIQRCADEPRGFVIAPQFAREFLEKMPKLAK